MDDDHSLLEIIMILKKLKVRIPKAVIKDKTQNKGMSPIEIILDLMLDLEDEGIKEFEGTLATMYGLVNQ